MRHRTPSGRSRGNKTLQPAAIAMPGASGRPGGVHALKEIGLGKPSLENKAPAISQQAGAGAEPRGSK